MKLRTITLSVLLLAISAHAQDDMNHRFKYPDAKKSDQVDTYHGAKVADPYRWLENPDSEESRKWIEEENKLTFDFLSKIPERESIKARLTKLWNYEKYSTPFKEGEQYFYFKNNGLQNQSVLYTMKSLTDTPRVLLDPNTFSKDGTVALAGLSISDDGKLLAYGISASGSDWNEWKVLDIETGKPLEDHIKWVKFSGASWTKDNKGFLYSRFAEPNEKTKLEDANYFMKLYYHKIGTPQSEDVLVYERKDHKEWGFGGGISEDGKFLVINVSQGTDPKNRFFYKELSPTGSPAEGKVIELIPDADASYNFIGNDGPLFWFITDLNAPKSKLIQIDIRKPARSEWKELIPQINETLQGVSYISDKFIASYLKDAHTQVKVFDLKGKFLSEVQLPGLGAAGGFGGKQKDTETFYSFTSFTYPSTVFRYDLTTGKSAVFKQPKVDFNPADYETRQVFFKSKDGTQVPMFITHKKGMKLDGNNPTYLYGYGGFNISLTPSFSTSLLVWMEMGGVFAQPNLRGGGEYGEDWHQAGTKLKKQNVFDDFIAAAEWLIANKYTSSPKLSIGGGSNGGLLVGACITQRPELFGAALPAVGVLDMLRYQKFTIGWAWVSDYGSSDNADEFKALYAYSPLHNIKPGAKYPATLITTADHDDRVVPAHSFKFAATLQAAQGGDEPILIRIETKAGHGAGKPTAKVIDEQTDKWAFLKKSLNF